VAPDPPAQGRFWNNSLAENALERLNYPQAALEAARLTIALTVGLDLGAYHETYKALHQDMVVTSVEQGLKPGERVKIVFDSKGNVVDVMGADDTMMAENMSARIAESNVPACGIPSTPREVRVPTASGWTDIPVRQRPTASAPAPAPRPAPTTGPPIRADRDPVDSGKLERGVDYDRLDDKYRPKRETDTA
jgi:hypothetical protein